MALNRIDLRPRKKPTYQELAAHNQAMLVGLRTLGAQFAQTDAGSTIISVEHTHKLKSMIEASDEMMLRVARGQ